MSIPRRIIQTHRSPDILRAERDTWTDQHSGYDYLFFDDAASRGFVEKHRPGLLATYDRLPLPVQKADLFRYLAVHEIGGIYADVDTVCCAPLHSYVDMDGPHLIGGLEMSLASSPGGHLKECLDHYIGPHQVANWTFAAPKGHLALALMMRRIEFFVGQMTDAQLASWSTDMRFTLQLTGPAAWTHIVNQFLDGTRQGAVAILPRMAWGALPREQQLPQNASAIKVRHLFAASWI